MSLETFVANEFNDIFSGRQLSQDVKVAPNLTAHESISFGATKLSEHPEDGDGVSSRIVEKPSQLDAIFCP